MNKRFLVAGLLAVALWFGWASVALAQTPVIGSFNAAVTTSNATTNWAFREFSCCVNGSGAVTFDCATLSATKGLVRNGQCISFDLDQPCGVLNYIGSAASTIDCYGAK